MSKEADVGLLGREKVRGSKFNATVGALSPANRERQTTVASREMYPGPEAGTFLGLRWTRLVADKSSFGCAYDIDDNVRTPLTRFNQFKAISTVPVYYTVLCGFRDITERTLATRPQDIRAQGGVCGAPLNAGNARPSMWNDHGRHGAPRNKSGKSKGAILLPDERQRSVSTRNGCCITAKIRLCRCPSCADNSQSQET